MAGMSRRQLPKEALEIRPIVQKGQDLRVLVRVIRRLEQAAHFARLSLEISQQWGNMELQAMGNVLLALIEHAQGNLEKALQLEVNNAPFYRDASSRAKTMKLQGVFKGLAKVEAEHASLIRKILNCEFPAPEAHREKATDDDMVNLKTAHERERIATDFYMMSAERAVEPRVKKVFTALSEIESDHIMLEDDLLNGYGA